jgi:iron(III) transport system ATP-binding protein
VIQVESLAKEYRSRGGRERVRAVDGVSFEVREGEFYTLLGPSGCGKTTTLRCLAGLERTDGGTIRLAGVEVASPTRFVPANRRDIGMVFQSYAVWPHMSVFDNVAFPIRHGRTHARGEDLRRRVTDALALVGMADLAGRGATQLSGGQQQRLALARALVSEPKVLLLDEPLSNLDAKLRERMRTEIRLLQRRLGITTVFVTHDQTEALSMSDRVAVMDGGRVVQEGSPREIYFRMKDAFTATFIGSTNLIPGEIRGTDAETGNVLVETALGCLQAPPGPDDATSGRVLIAIRPEDVELVPSAGQTPASAAVNRFPGRVEVELFGGSYTDYFVAAGSDVRLRARAASRLRIEPDSSLEVRLRPEVCQLLSDVPADVAHLEPTE